MTPGQLQVLAQLHAVANGADDSSVETKDPEQGTVGDLLAFASMTRR